MLLSLHVKNLALIEEAEISFGQGLNILTGETGAGKSVLLGAVNMALGEKTDRDAIRSGADYALAELVFKLEDEKLKSELAGEGFFADENGEMILKRKIMPGRTVSSINGETVTASEMKRIAEGLIHIHGQRDNQILLKPNNQRVYLDTYAGDDLSRVYKEYEQNYGTYIQYKKEYDSLSKEDGLKAKEIELAGYEIREIEEAAIKPGEYEELHRKYKKMSDSVKILELASGASQMTGYDEEMSAGHVIGEAVRLLKQVSVLDEEAQELLSELENIDSLLGDFNKGIHRYISSLDFDEEDFRITESRVTQLGKLIDKYGMDEEGILAYAQEKRELLDKYGDMDAYKKQLEKKMSDAQKRMMDSADILTDLRRRAGDKLSQEMQRALEDLNFLETKFEVRFEHKDMPSNYGMEDVVFYISMNPGEPLKPLINVASGGELSRIMLALRTLQVENSEASCMIFDEIDQGISGQTAGKVAERLGRLAEGTQVICITHLPQIAAMADKHFKIEKNVCSGRTITTVGCLDEEESILEIARMGAGSEVTDASVHAARELRKNCRK